MENQLSRFATGFLLHDVSRLRKKVVDQELKPLGITRSQWWVLVNISKHGQEGIAQTELARVMSVGKVSLGGLIDRMEAAGWLERIPDSKDRRSKKVVMTSSGKQILKEVQEFAVGINKNIMTGISREQNEQLDGLLRTMMQNLIKMDS